MVLAQRTCQNNHVRGSLATFLESRHSPEVVLAQGLLLHSCYLSLLYRKYYVCLSFNFARFLLQLVVVGLCHRSVQLKRS